MSHKFLEPIKIGNQTVKNRVMFLAMAKDIRVILVKLADLISTTAYPQKTSPMWNRSPRAAWGFLFPAQ